MDALSQLLSGGEAGLLALLATALGLGLRQGLDWHHAIAIADICGLSAAPPASGPAPATSRSPIASPPVPAPPRRLGVRTLVLAGIYALAHATVVLLLGAATLAFSESLPDWAEPFAERLVGALLVALGLLLACSLVAALRHGGAMPANRLALLRRVWRGTRSVLAQRPVRYQAFRRRRQQAAFGGGASTGADPSCGDGFHVHLTGEYAPYGARAALATGIVHGLGAETVPPVLMLAAAGTAAGGGSALGAGLVLAFVAGMLASNAALALATTLGFLSARRARPVYAALGLLSAAASLYVGLELLAGSAGGH